MGSSSKKYKDRESSSGRKRRHGSPGPPSEETHEPPREKRHKHKHKHHKERRREKNREERGSRQAYEEVIQVLSDDEKPPQSQPQTSIEESTSSGQGADNLSIEETNKLRAKLGLKPLELQTKSRDDGKKKDDLGEFYHKPAENWADKAKQEKIRKKLAEHREKRQMQTKLSKVKTLGESDSEDDTSNWVERNRKIEKAKKEAAKRAKMLEELDAQFGIGEVVEQEQKDRRNRKYTARDLKGLRVEHDIATIADEKQVILTLKDSGVLEENEDVLVNVNMLDNEKYKKNIEIKKKKVLYNAYEDQEYDEYGIPKEKSLLAQYDEEIDGPKKEGFHIGEENSLEMRKKAAVVQSVKEKLAKKTLETIAEKNLVLASEYYNEEEMAKFKKPKKKTRRIRAKGKLTAEELMPVQKVEKIGSRRNRMKMYEDGSEMSIDDVPDVTIPEGMKIEDEKDDLLEKALHKARKIKQKENIIADIMKQEVKEEPQEETDAGNIILNSTAEFCRTLGDIPTYGKAGNREEEEDLLDFEKEAANDEKSDDDDCEIVETSGWNSVDTRTEGVNLAKLTQQEIPILEEEPDVSTGVGAALKLAMSKGYLDREENNRPSNSRFAHLQAKHYSIEDKNYGEESGERGRGGGARERYAGPVQDFREKDGFKPNVKLEYIDDDGHILNSKEAFRYLSHKFHGKGPGKNKVEKRIKKSVQEQLMKKMSSTDTPLGTLNMLQAKQKETQSAFVVLSGSKQQQQTAIAKNRR